MPIHTTRFSKVLAVLLSLALPMLARGQVMTGAARFSGTGSLGYIPPFFIEPTPPMGVNTWVYGWAVLYPATGATGDDFSGNNKSYYATEARVKADADGMVSTALPGMNGVSLASLGYNMVSIDAGWQASARVNGQLAANPTTFPDGIPDTVSYLHSRNLLVGLYGSPGQHDCIFLPASYTFEQVDAQTLANWNIDYWKHDLCYATDQWGSSNADMQLAFQTFGSAIAATHHKMAYHVNAYSAYGSVGWANTVGATSVRIGGDNDDGTWYGKAQSLNGETWDLWRDYQHKGLWLDPDVLMFQLNEAFYDNKAGQTPQIEGDVEGRSQFNWYSLIAAPLFIGTDINQLNAASLATLSNKEVIAVDQDSLGLMGWRVSQTTCGSANCAVWVRQLANGYAVGFFNFDPSASHDVSVTWSQFSQSGTFNMRDLWAHASVGSSSTGYTAAAIPAFGSVVLLLTR